MENFQIENGVLVKYTGYDEALVVPEGVRSIGEEAFYYCDDLTDITIPASVTEIHKNAFEGTYVTIHAPAGSYAAQWAEENDFQWTTVAVLPGGQSFWGEDGVLVKYNGYDDEVVVPEGVTSIGEEAFYYGDLTDITLPASVTEIHEDAFYMDAQVTIHAPAGSYAAQWAEEHGVKLVTED